MVMGKVEGTTMHPCVCNYITYPHGHVYMTNTMLPCVSNNITRPCVCEKTNAPMCEQ